MDKYMNLAGGDNPSTVLVEGFTTSGKNQEDVFISKENRLKHARTMKVLLEPRYIYKITQDPENPKFVEFRVASYKAAFIMQYTIINPNEDKKWYILAEKRIEDLEFLKRHEYNYLDALRPRVESGGLWARSMRVLSKNLLNEFLNRKEIHKLVTHRYRINGIGGSIRPTLYELYEHLGHVTNNVNSTKLFNFILSDEQCRFSVKLGTNHGTSAVYHYRLEYVEDKWLFDEEFNDSEYLTDKIVENRNLNVLRWGDNIRH